MLFSVSPIEEADYKVKVKVDGKWLNDDKPGTFCYGNCIFYVSSSFVFLDKINLFQSHLIVASKCFNKTVQSRNVMLIKHKKVAALIHYLQNPKNRKKLHSQQDKQALAFLENCVPFFQIFCHSEPKFFYLFNTNY